MKVSLLLLYSSTGLIKSNRPLYVSVSHKQGNKLSDLKFPRHIGHVINDLLTEFQIRILSHIATMSMWTNALFAVQIQVWQLVVEARNFAGCAIYVGHVSSIGCFLLSISSTQHLLQRIARVYGKYQLFTVRITADYGPHITKTYWIHRRGPHNSHTYPIAEHYEPTTEWYLKAWYSTDSLGL